MDAGWALVATWIQNYGLLRLRLVKSQHFSTAVGWKERDHYSLHRFQTDWPEFWVGLEDPAKITRYEQSLVYPEKRPLQKPAQLVDNSVLRMSARILRSLLGLGKRGEVQTPWSMRSLLISNIDQ